MSILQMLLCCNANHCCDVASAGRWPKDTFVSEVLSEVLSEVNLLLPMYAAPQVPNKHNK